VRVQVGLGETMDVLDSSRREADRSTHTDDLVALEAVAALHPEAATFEAWLRELLARPPASGPAVLLSTIHRIKGREWEHVIVYGASEGLLPHRLSEDEEGERRVFHVALTRAIRQVVVLADAEAPSPFVAELDGSRPRQAISPTGAGRKTDRRQGAAPGGRSTKRPARSMPRVRAEVGLALEYGGHGGTVVELSESAAVLQVGAARLQVVLGSEVRVQGATVVLAAPGDGEEAPSSAEPYEGALRAWRSGVAKRESLPAYVVLNDNELAGIAATKPGTLAELARCKGIGPNRLERWGDELLAVLGGVDGE
jgi:DNA helicase-2/ATP-dependent DNA helicase PcrA